jgi:hypothetical protein
MRKREGSAPVELLRDATIFSGSGTEIDFRTPDYSVWVTIKADSDEQAEAVAAAFKSSFPPGEETP